MPLAAATKELLRRLIRRPWSAGIFGWLLARRLRLLHDSQDPDAIDVLVFSEMRWRQDLQALARGGPLRLYAIDEALMNRINALFTAPGKTPHLQYFMEADPEILRLRRELTAYLERVVRALRRHSGLACAATTAIHYRREHCWAEACDRAGLPFVAFHKEFTVLDESQLALRVKRFRQRKQAFTGSHICVANETGKKLFAQAGVFPEERITVMGLLRIDELLRQGQHRPAEAKSDAKVVTLFSFGHASGGVRIKHFRSAYFSRDSDQGFVELFKDVHAGFAEAALRHPDVEFKIKPKAAMDDWINEIRQAIEDGLGRSIDSIPNCQIVADPAPQLIEESLATIGFNSTVLLESCLMGCNTIMPHFHEAVSKYPTFVFFPEFRDVFALATSKADLVEKIGRAIDGAVLSGSDPARLSELCRYYLGYDDGHTAARAAAVLQDVVAGRLPPPSFTPGPSAIVERGRQGEAAASPALPLAESA